MRNNSQAQLAADELAAYYVEQAADELAAYFRSAEYRDELFRQAACHKTRATRRQRADFGLAKYWRDNGYAHAANVAAAILTKGNAA